MQCVECCVKPLCWGLCAQKFCQQYIFTNKLVSIPSAEAKSFTSAIHRASPFLIVDATTTRCPKKLLDRSKKRVAVSKARASSRALGINVGSLKVGNKRSSSCNASSYVHFVASSVCFGISRSYQFVNCAHAICKVTDMTISCRSSC